MMMTMMMMMMTIVLAVALEVVAVVVVVLVVVAVVVAVVVGRCEHTIAFASAIGVAISDGSCYSLSLYRNPSGDSPVWAVHHV